MPLAVDRPSRAWRSAGVVAAVLWCVSLALPVYRSSSPHVFAADPLQGWQVLYMAPLMLTWAVSIPWLANPAGAAALFWAIRGRRPPKGLSLLSLSLAASLLIWWGPFPTDGLSTRDLVIGCWVWLASFVPLAAMDLATALRQPKAESD